MSFGVGGVEVFKVHTIQNAFANSTNLQSRATIPLFKPYHILCSIRPLRLLLLRLFELFLFFGFGEFEYHH